MRHIHETNIRKLDFRLLELFQAILQYKSLTDAALLLEIPQPTASRGLNRLREALGDELFVRTAHGMEPTTRAVEMGETIEQILRLGNLLETVKKPFDPKSAVREFVIAGSDVGQWAIMPAFYRAVTQYPGIRLRTISVPGTDLAHILENGDIDLAFGPYPTLLGSIKEQTLYSEEYRCFCHADHPFAASATLENFMESNHLIATGRAFAHAHRETEAKLLRLLPPHHIRIISESYMVALATLTETNLIFTTPAVAIRRIALKFGLVELTPPLELPTFEVKQYWHYRNDDDSGHRWLRTTLRSALIAANVGGMGKTRPTWALPSP